MQIVYEGGVPLRGPGFEKGADFCLKQPDKPCNAWSVRRLSLCGAISTATPRIAASCADSPEGDPYADVLMAPVLSRRGE
jgi:hypothetical protein